MTGDGDDDAKITAALAALPLDSFQLVGDNDGGGGGALPTTTAQQQDAALATALADKKVPDWLANDPRFAEFIKTDPDTQTHVQATEQDIAAEVTDRIEEQVRRTVAAEMLRRDRNPSAPTASQMPSLLGDRDAPKTSADGGASSVFREAARPAASFVNDAQQFALVNLAHRDLCPASRRPAVRVLGLFPDKEAARAHAVTTLLKRHAHDLDLHVVPTHRPFLIPRTRERQRDEQYVVTAIESRQREHEAFRSRGTETFDENVQERRGGKTGESAYVAKIKARKRVNLVREAALDKTGELRDAVQKQLAATRSRGQSRTHAMRRLFASKKRARTADEAAARGATATASTTIADDADADDDAAAAAAAIAPPLTGAQKKAAKAKAKAAAKKNKNKRNLVLLDSHTATGKQVVAPVPEDARVPRQRHVCVAFLLDYSDAVLANDADPEPAVCIYGAFESVDEAENYVQNTASRYEKSYNIDVVDMYEWIHPEDVDEEKLTEVYRDPELNRIMNARKKEKERLENFEEFCSAIGQDMPVTEMVYNNETGETAITAAKTGFSDVKMIDRVANPVDADTDNATDAALAGAFSNATPVLPGTDETRFLADLAGADSAQQRLMAAKTSASN